MNRRNFLSLALAVPVVGRASLFLPLAAAAEPSHDDSRQDTKWRGFEVTTRVTLPEDTGAAELYLPMAQTAAGYQTVEATRWEGTGTPERLTDPRYGASVLRSQWEAGRQPKSVALVQTVATRERFPMPLLALSEAERRFWTAPTPRIVLETAAKITAGATTKRAQLRAIYDWVVDHTHRDPDTPGYGTGDVCRSLESGNLGGKCADINSLLVGLARAAGFPAREVYGVRVADSKVYPCLGKSGDVTKAQHCRCEVFLEDEGWFPLDPADVCKVVLEGKVALDSPEGRTLRERMFGNWETNWIGYNSATDIALPGSGGKKPEFCFLMYPCAFTEKGVMPCLDPARFRYEIVARELAV